MDFELPEDVAKETGVSLSLTGKEAKSSGSTPPDIYNIDIAAQKQKLGLKLDRVAAE